jgi:hypothetical protein
MYNSHQNQKPIHQMPLNPISIAPHISHVMMHPTTKFSPIPQYQLPSIGSAIVPPMGGGLPNPPNFPTKPAPQFDNSKQRIDKLFNTKS